MKKLIFGILVMTVAISACKKDEKENPPPSSVVTPPDGGSHENFNIDSPQLLGTYIAVASDGLGFTRDTFSIFQIGSHYHMNCPLRLADPGKDTSQLFVTGKSFAIHKDTVNVSMNYTIQASGNIENTDLLVVFGGSISSTRHFTKQ